jgi:hypothetical protein
MNMFLLFTIMLIPISVIWVRRIDYMKDNYPEYKGKDLFNEDNEKV